MFKSHATEVYVELFLVSGVIDSMCYVLVDVDFVVPHAAI